MGILDDLANAVLDVAKGDFKDAAKDAGAAVGEAGNQVYNVAADAGDVIAIDWIGAGAVIDAIGAAVSGHDAGAAFTHGVMAALPFIIDFGNRIDGYRDGPGEHDTFSRAADATASQSLHATAGGGARALAVAASGLVAAPGAQHSTGDVSSTTPGHSAGHVSPPPDFSAGHFDHAPLVHFDLIHH